MFKKTVSWLFLACMLLSLTACQKEPDPGPTPEPEETTVVTPEEPEKLGITAITSTDTEWSVLRGEWVRGGFWIETDDDFTVEDIQLISDRPEVAAAEISEKDPALVHYIIMGVSSGESAIRLQTADGGVQSEPIKVTVLSSGRSYDENRVVYVTENGVKYHDSKSCAGHYATATTLKEAQDILRIDGFCKTCVK